MSRNLADDLRLALDPVAFARVAGIEPDPWQADFLRSDARRILVNCARQSGKSTVAAARSLHNALYNPGSLTLLISPSQRQSSELFRKVADMFGRLPGRPSLVEDNRLSLALPSGSRIVSLPSGEATIRGFSGVSLIVEDEAAYTGDELYRACRPMLAASGGSLILASTPNGQRGHFWSEWENGGPTWQRIRVTAADCPRIPSEFLVDEQRSLGARIFQQEYGAEFLGEVAGALWSRALLDGTRVQRAPSLVRTVVGVDPAVTYGPESDETGIVVAGIDAERNVYVLADYSGRYPPDRWAERVAAAYELHRAGRVVAEGNQGGDLVEGVLKAAHPDLPVKIVHARVGKQARAEPIAALYEAGRAHHVGSLPALEDQLCSWAPGSRASPDRLDAMVWAVASLLRMSVDPCYLPGHEYVFPPSWARDRGRI